MANIQVLSKLTRAAKLVKMKTVKRSPELLIATSIVTGVGAIGLACKATLKVEEVLEPAKADLEKIRMAHNGELEIKEGEEYTDKDYKKDLTTVYVQTGLKVAKLYLPSVALWTLSVTSLLGSHKILSKRNAALATAYTAVEKGFQEYRGRVTEELGEDMDKHFRYGTKLEEVIEETTDENGRKKKTKKKVDVVDKEPGIYARFFDETSAAWTKDPEYNFMFLKAQQNYFNHKLTRDGYVFLNDVYEQLGMDKSAIGQVVGWMYDETLPAEESGISFGIFEAHNERKRAFVNGYEPSILLDFNVQGDILSLM